MSPPPYQTSQHTSSMQSLRSLSFDSSTSCLDVLSPTPGRPLMLSVLSPMSTCFQRNLLASFRSRVPELRCLIVVVHAKTLAKHILIRRTNDCLDCHSCTNSNSRDRLPPELNSPRIRTCLKYSLSA